MAEIKGSDLAVIYDTLLRLAGDEGSTVVEALAAVSDADTALRIYDDVFTVEAMSHAS